MSCLLKLFSREASGDDVMDRITKTWADDLTPELLDVLHAGKLFAVRFKDLKIDYPGRCSLHQMFADKTRGETQQLPTLL